MKGKLSFLNNCNRIRGFKGSRGRVKTTRPSTGSGRQKEVAKGASGQVQKSEVQKCKKAKEQKCKVGSAKVKRFFLNSDLNLANIF